MIRLFASLIAGAFLCFASTASACPAPRVQIVTRAVNHGVSYATYGYRTSTALGQALAMPSHNVSVRVVRNTGCVVAAHVSISTSFMGGLMILVDPRLVHGSCARRVVLDHERVHIQDAIQAARETNSTVAASVRRRGGTIEEWSNAEGALRAMMDDVYRGLERSAVYRRDTAANYRDIFAACSDWPAGASPPH